MYSFTLVSLPSLLVLNDTGVAMLSHGQHLPAVRRHWVACWLADPMCSASWCWHGLLIFNCLTVAAINARASCLVAFSAFHVGQLTPVCVLAH
jgi:hypothetical protein